MRRPPNRRRRPEPIAKPRRVPRPPALLPACAAWLAAQGGRLRPGQEVYVHHQDGCPYPRGGACLCPEGPRIRVQGERPSDN